MGSRSRSRNRRAWTGGAVYWTYNSSLWSSGYSGVVDHESCSDVTMTKPYVIDHPLTITRRQARSVLRLNGEIPYNPASAGYKTLVYSDYNPANRSNYVYAPTLPPFDSNYWKTKALASINPYRPKFDVPLFIWELKDLPGLLKNAGDWLIRIRKKGLRGSAALDPNSILIYELGMAPLVSDLISLFGLAADVDERIRQLKALEDGTRIKRRLARGDTSDIINGSLYTVTAPYRTIYSAYKRDRIREDVWFTVNAKLKHPLPNEDAKLRRLSEDIILGLTLQPYQFWDFVPWTWLIDYFFNIGDFVEAQNGLVHMSVTRMNLMAKRVYSSTLLPLYVEGGITASPSVLETTEKRRYVYANPTPSFAADPFLSGRQTAILGALALSRNRAIYSSGLRG